MEKESGETTTLATTSLESDVDFTNYSTGGLDINTGIALRQGTWNEDLYNHIRQRQFGLHFQKGCKLIPNRWIIFVTDCGWYIYI